VSDRKRLIEPEHEWLTLTRQAELLDIARSSIYTHPIPLSEDTLALHHALDRLYTAHPYYGQRRCRSH
jgi:putative transposase